MNNTFKKSEFLETIKKIEVESQRTMSDQRVIV